MGCVLCDVYCQAARAGRIFLLCLTRKHIHVLHPPPRSAGYESQTKALTAEMKVKADKEFLAQAKVKGAQEQWKTQANNCELSEEKLKQELVAVQDTSVMQTNQAAKSSAEKSCAMASLPKQRPDASK